MQYFNLKSLTYKHFNLFKFNLIVYKNLIFNLGNLRKQFKLVNLIIQNFLGLSTRSHTLSSKKM